MMQYKEADLNPWNDADDLIHTLGQIQDQQQTQLIDAVMELTEHSDPDVREEALRLLLLRWKVQEAHQLALDALLDGQTPELQALAAYGVAATSSEPSRIEDATILKAVLSDEDRDDHVRGAAYDALLIIFRNPAFPTKRTSFSAQRDVDWEWIKGLPGS